MLGLGYKAIFTWLWAGPGAALHALAAPVGPLKPVGLLSPPAGHSVFQGLKTGALKSGSLQRPRGGGVWP